MILIFLFILTGILFVGKIHSFLTYSNPVQSRNMLIEGWLNNYALEIAANKFKEGNYNKILTTGGRLPDFFKLSVQGGIIFKLDEISLSVNSDQIEYISLKCYGYKAIGVFPHVNLWADSTLIANFYVDRMEKEYSFKIPSSIKRIDKIIVEYTNDAYDEYSDRDLIISSINIEGEVLPIRGKGRYFDEGKIDGHQLIEIIARDFAVQAASMLKYYGVASESIEAISPIDTEFNRTLKNAQSVADWFKYNGDNIHSLNIISFDTHTRRSLMIYKKILPSNIDLGIISIRNYNYDPNCWYMQKSGIKAVFYESIACVYYAVLLLFV
ncbi:MAG: carbohydrate-binding domain-containing protein [Bacteroidota bacterium]|nr:carbohydrate-binding domain-containing protein [Bacteroidota bacterium]